MIGSHAASIQEAELAELCTPAYVNVVLNEWYWLVAHLNLFLLILL